MKILLIDNYDSFTYNVAAALRSLGVDPDVIRNDQITVDEVEAMNPDGIIISPGPGIPSEAGIVPELIARMAVAGTPVLGVCLGHQAIGEFSGASLINLPKVYHGIHTPVTLTDEGRADYLFKGMPDRFEVGRYHSWAISREGLPDDLAVTALSPDGCIMAAAHRRYDLRGVQFHPESILTPEGSKIFENWLNHISRR